MGAGDIAASGTTSQLDATSTGDLIRAAAPDSVFTLGNNTLGSDTLGDNTLADNTLADSANASGTATEYSTQYDPTWGSFQAITKPAPGNNEYDMTPPAAAYIDYYGAPVVTNPQDGGVYYAWDIGNGWRGYSLNSEISMSTSSAQYAWLTADLNAHPSGHFIAYWHQPRYVSGSQHTDRTDQTAIWALLQAHGTDIVMSAGEHHYERFAKMNGGGVLDSAGIRGFIVGTGGNQTHAPSSPLHLGNQFINALDYGVLKLTLHTNSYDWAFIGSGRGFNGESVTTANKGVVLDSGTQATNTTIGTPKTLSPPRLASPPLFTPPSIFAPPPPFVPPPLFAPPSIFAPPPGLAPPMPTPPLLMLPPDLRPPSRLAPPPRTTPSPTSTTPPPTETTTASPPPPPAETTTPPPTETATTPPPPPPPPPAETTTAPPPAETTTAPPPAETTTAPPPTETTTAPPPTETTPPATTL